MSDTPEVEIQEAKASNPRAVTGVVTSDRMEKSITVKVERRVKHPVYGKFVRKSSKIHAHDENNDCNVGDTVTVIECRAVQNKDLEAAKHRRSIYRSLTRHDSDRNNVGNR